METPVPSKRFESLDILRGLCMFGLTVLPYLFWMVYDVSSAPFLDAIKDQFSHSEWRGVTYLDILMPLFMFCSGASIPFAFKKYRDQNWSKGKIYWKIIRRVLILWILGMTVQGKLLTLDPSRFRYYSNTLQAIAVGYLVASLMFLHTKPTTQIITTFVLMLIYTVVMLYVRVGEYGGVDTLGKTFANFCDIKILGITGGHTWTFSSISFAVTAMSGTLSGELLQSRKSDNQKALWLLGGGAAMIAAGLLWSLWFPCIKQIWSTSFVLLMAGLDFILYGIIYWCVDIHGWKKGWNWLKIFGMNALLAYLVDHFVDFKPLARTFLGGLEQYMSGPWYSFTIAFADRLIFMGILYLCYKKKIYLKV